MQNNALLIEQMPFPYFMIDSEFHILLSSNTAKQIFSNTTSLMDLFEPPQRAQLKHFLLTYDVTRSHKLQMINKDGQRKLFQLFRLITDDQYNHLFCIPVDTDSLKIYDMLDNVEKRISHLNVELVSNKQNYDQTVQQLKETALHSDHLATIAKLAAGIAHEIRNPLTTVKGFIQLLKPYLSDIGKEEYAQIALEEIERADDIIYQFLNAAKPQQNKKQQIDANKLVKDIVLLYESEAIIQNIKIDAHYESEKAIVYIDSKQLKQVLINIVKNAIEAICENGVELQGTIHLSIERINNYAVIIIEDNGIGMKEETLQNLYVPFYTTKETGTGIGLSVCKKIIEDHGGKITVKSHANQGTRFRIEIPIVEPLSLNENQHQDLATS